MRVPIYLARLALEGRAPTSADVVSMSDFLSARTALSAGADGDRALAASAHPGYLQRDVDSETIYVPFHLAPVFPQLPVLKDARRIARSVALSNDNPICISGSTTFLGKLATIGDLDFCEYLFSDPQHVARAVCGKADVGPPLPLIKVKCAKKKLAPPWEALEERTQTALFDNVAFPPANDLMLDFISSSGTLGLLPSTSLVLPMGEDSEAGHAAKSFVFQEAVLAAAGPPRTLLAPESFADYLGWLLKEAKALLDGSHPKSPQDPAGKALKRLLSFLLAVGRDDLVENVLAGLNDDDLLLVVRMMRRVELIHALEHMEGAGRDWLEGLLQAQDEEHGTDAPATDEIKEILEQTAVLAGIMVEEIELMLKEVGEAA